MVVRDGKVSVGLTEDGTSLIDVGTGEVDVAGGAVIPVVLVFVVVVVMVVGVVTVTGEGTLVVEDEDGVSSTADSSFSAGSSCVPSSLPSAGSSECMICVEFLKVSSVAVGVTKVDESKAGSAEVVGRMATDADEMGSREVIGKSEDCGMMGACGGTEDIFVIFVTEGLAETEKPEELGNNSGM